MAGGKLCFVCIGLSGLTKKAEPEPTELPEGKITRRPFGGDPRAAREKSVQNKRTCMAKIDDGSRGCEQTAVKNSPFCCEHISARRDPDLETDKALDLSTCIAMVDHNERCGGPVFNRSFCKEHWESRVLLTSNFAPRTVEPIDIDDNEAKLKRLHLRMSQMEDIIEHGPENRDRINAARALERMMATANRMHKDLIKERRSKDKDLEYKILGVHSDLNGMGMEIPSLDEFKSSLPEGDVY